MNFKDRFNAAFPQMLPNGLSLNSLPQPVNQFPIQGPIPLPLPRPLGAEVPTMVYNSPGGPATDPNAPPFRLDRGAVPPMEAPPPAMAAPMQPSVFPTAGAPAVPYSRPAVEAGPKGLTLASAPTPGWGGTVETAPPPVEEAKKPEEKKPDADKVFAGLEEINKGIQNKVSPQEAAAAATITPSSAAAQPNSSNAMAAEIMATLLRGKQRGLTLTGRPL